MMILITVQHKNVYDILAHNEIYHAPTVRHENLKRPYQMMYEHYNWNIKAPIFACVQNRRCNFYGCDPDDAYILTLNVPDKIVKLQSYYDWVDVIYFTEFPGEWNKNNSLISFEQFVRDTLDGLNVNDPYQTVQATIPCIRPEWLVKYEPFNDDFSQYIGTGGNSILTYGI